MRRKRREKLIHEGKYVAEVEVEVMTNDDEWAPYISLKDAYKIDDVREALRRGDIRTAATSAKVYTLSPVST